MTGKYKRKYKRIYTGKYKKKYKADTKEIKYKGEYERKKIQRGIRAVPRYELPLAYCVPSYESLGL